MSDTAKRAAHVDVASAVDRPPAVDVVSGVDLPLASRARGLETVAVLGVSLGMSAIYALMYLIRAQVTVKGGIAATTATVVSGPNTRYVWLDVLDNLADVAHGLFPGLLAIALLVRDPGGGGLGIGLDRLRARVDWLAGIGFTALIGIPGLALVWAARELGLNASLAVVDLPDLWYRVPLLLLEAAQNGILEELVVVGYLLTRLRQLGWADYPALGASAVLRGSYHLYQGWGGFLGNMVMGLMFGWWFQRTRRVLPLVIAHTLLDAISFLGYVYLHGRVSWI
ncbi:MAG: CPBP family intramembrane glutamic endopeptidase [Actinomycetota bacterium]